MWKIVFFLLLTAFAMLGARLAYDAPLVWSKLGAAVGIPSAPAPVTPPLMYAGIRG
ncbi:MAG TPA: hypothetical protein VNJ31_08135 [Methyloceanibacter sp.]|nr:hypothetical protein [Methyloceanibacter sp.]